MANAGAMDINSGIWFAADEHRAVHGFFCRTTKRAAGAFGFAVKPVSTATSRWRASVPTIYLRSARASFTGFPSRWPSTAVTACLVLQYQHHERRR